MLWKSGAIAWIHQLTAGDVFGCRAGSANCGEKAGPDFDLGTPPMLITRSDGRDLIVAEQKSGSAFALDPDKEGAQLWQYHAGEGSIWGGIQWGAAVDGEAEPDIGLQVVLRHAEADAVQASEHGLSQGESLIGGAAVPPDRLCRVGRDAMPEEESRREVELGRRIALLGRPSVPVERLGLVLRHRLAAGEKNP